MLRKFKDFFDWASVQLGVTTRELVLATAGCCMGFAYLVFTYFCIHIFY